MSSAPAAPPVPELEADSPWNLDSYDFELPPAQIAQVPPPTRHQARLMVVDRTTGNAQPRVFPDFLAELRPGDVLVRNQAKVEPTKFRGRKQGTGGIVEFLLLDPLDSHRFSAKLRPSKKTKPGTRVELGPSPGGLQVEVQETLPGGLRAVDFGSLENFERAKQEAGEVPLPPYIESREAPSERYQTVFARDPGSAAAPTAGFHFEEGDFEALQAHGVEVLNLTLHVGLGTFAPVRDPDLRRIEMHPERFQVPRATLEGLLRAKREGRRIVSIGTTACRALESLPDWDRLDPSKDLGGETELFLGPDSRFRWVDALLTNFHLPRSTLLVLVSSFLGKEATLEVYRKAVAEGFRFFSFGDACWIR